MTLSQHLKILEDAKPIHQSHNYSLSDNRKKVYTLKVDQIQINFPQKIYLPFQKKTSEIRLGFFSDFSVCATCGLASTENIIGDMDDPRSFVLNERINASLLWFSAGYVEYKIQNLLEQDQTPGNYSDVRGKYTPAWWDSNFSQYGLLKHLRVNHFDTVMDGHQISTVRLEDLHLTDSPFIKLHIGIKPDAENTEGLTIFGSGFGNHDQNMLLSVYYS